MVAKQDEHPQVYQKKSLKLILNFSPEMFFFFSTEKSMQQHLYHDYPTHVRVLMLEPGPRVGVSVGVGVGWVWRWRWGGVIEEPSCGWGNPFQRGKMKTLSHLPSLLPPSKSFLSLSLSLSRSRSRSPTPPIGYRTISHNNINYSVACTRCH